MKNVFSVLLIVGLLTLGWVNRGKLTGLRGEPSTIDQPATPEVAPPGSTPASSAQSAPAPPATPHPAKEALAAVRQAYPALFIPESPLNKKFVALHAEAERHNPALLAQPNWPVTLAERAAIALGGGVMPLPTTPAPPKPLGLQGSALDKKPKGHP
jgi:hypothetical protein